MPSSGTTVTIGGDLNARGIPIMVRTTKDRVGQVASVADGVIESVRRAHFKAVQSALDRDGFEGQVSDTCQDFGDLETGGIDGGDRQ